LGSLAAKPDGTEKPDLQRRVFGFLLIAFGRNPTGLIMRFAWSVACRRVFGFLGFFWRSVPLRRIGGHV
jgi:hypothetical protein